MSRTDAHRPPWVWVNDHPELVRELHDHTGGVCDLPAGRPLTAAELGPIRRGTCHVLLDERVRLCACTLCTGRTSRVRDKRARRTSERVLTRAWVRCASDAELDRLEGDLVLAELGW